MEDLFAQFTFFSDQALRDKSFDPSTIEDLMKLFEVEAYKAWAAVELSCESEAAEAERSLEEADEYLESEMEKAMEEFRRFEEEMDGLANAELSYLVRTGEAARKMGHWMERAATVASNKYVEAAINSALTSMRSAWKTISSSSSSTPKVHPSS